MAVPLESPGKPYQPLSQFYHSAATVRNKLYMWGGILLPYRVSVEDYIKHIDEFDFHMETWTKRSTNGSFPQWELFGASATACDDQHIYIYGKYLHQLDVDTFVWTQLSGPMGGMDSPLRKSGAGMVYYDQKLLLFGGKVNKEPSHPLQAGSQYAGGYVNEQHIFDLRKGTWSSPVIRGAWPSPCANFTFTKIDEHRVVLYGGVSERSRGQLGDIYMLELNNMFWSQLFSPVDAMRRREKYPLARFGHGAVCLGYGGQNPQLLIFAGSALEYYDDMWLFNLQTLTWRKIFLPKKYLLCRSSHSAVSCSPNPGETKVVIFGGSRHFDTCSDTVILTFGVQSLQELSLAVIKGAFSKRVRLVNKSRAISKPEAKVKSPEELCTELPDYVPPAIKQCVLNSLKKPSHTKIVLSHTASY